MNEPSYRMTTLGCRVNRADSRAIEKDLAARGYRQAPPDQVPDVWVVNTCAVTSEGMRKSRKAVRRLAATGAKVIVTGCGADYDPDAFNVEGVVSVIPNRQKDALVEQVFGGECVSPCEIPHVREELVRIPIKVQDGCRRYCAYCIVPHLRGDPSSKPITEIVREIEDIEARGAGEAILCGIDLGSYSEPGTGARLAAVVEAAKDAAPDMWIRLSSIELSDVDDAILELMLHDRLCKHLHVPLQSGATEVLKGMGRHYTADEFGRRVADIRSAVPDISISSDVMVGFPGETEEHHQSSLDLVEELGVTRLHVFKYSRRRGTRAYALGETVSPELKQRRADDMRSVAGRTGARFHEGLVGRIIPVLVEEAMKSDQGLLFGRSESFAPVVFEGSDDLIGTRTLVKIVSSESDCVRGTPTGIAAGEQGEDCVGG